VKLADQIAELKTLVVELMERFEQERRSKADPIRVYVVKRAERENYYLKWNDPVTGKEKKCSSGTPDRKQATELALKKQKELSAELRAILQRRKKRDKIKSNMRYRVLVRDGYACKACGKGLDHDVVLHVDHILPVAKGGKTVEDNLQTLCEDCNQGKGAS
jgi:5-methylcytosine-specific restriction endonuclease McrA